MKMSPTLLKLNSQNSGYIPNGPLSPLVWFFYWQQKIISKHRQQHKDEFLLKSFRSLTKYFVVLTQRSFVPLGTTLTHTTTKLNKLSNFLESNQFIYCDRWNYKNRHPSHNLPQTCGYSKFECLVWNVPLKIFYHNQEQVSVSMYNDPINMIQISQKIHKIWL